VTQRTRPTPVAVIGIGCVLPDARDPDAFWQRNLEGHCAIRELGGSTWDWNQYFDPHEDAVDRTYSKLGAQIRDYEFDWRRFKIPPVEAEQINAMQLMVLDAGVQALDRVRVIPRETTGLFIGATGLGWQAQHGLRIHMQRMLRNLDHAGSSLGLAADRRAMLIESIRHTLDRRLGPVTEDTVVNTAASVAIGRIAMFHDLRGLHYAVDAGFASSLAALDVAVKALRDHTIDLAVVGGASELIAPLELVAFAKMGGLAHERLAAFDANAEGTLLGEGTVMFALKRLDDAVRDGERIRAVILGVGGSSDGRGKALLAPRHEGQVLAMRRAWDDAGVDPRTVAFIECHATGTRVGDRSELEALRGLLHGGLEPGSIALGSGKAFVGHLRGAAGALALLRAILVLENRTIPGQINVRELNPQLRGGDCPFYVPTSNTPLPQPHGDHAARAAVSAFGFGGNNFHAVLEAWDPEVRYPPTQPVANDEPIAIVGMGGRFPEANSIEEFANKLAQGYDATREVPAERWAIDDHYDPNIDRQETTYSRLGCFVDLPESLDAEQIRRLRILPAARERIDPGHVVVFDAVREALADAGFSDDSPKPGWDHDRVASMLAFLPYQGAKFSADLRVNFAEYAKAIREAAEQLPSSARLDSETLRKLIAETEKLLVGNIPTISEDTMTGYLGSINCARIHAAFDFHGPHFVIDSACASSHAAVHAAASALRHRTCDVALTGGIWVDMRPEFYVAACRFHALSATGITPFDAAADGFVPGEGGGVLVLRRLSDAVRDGQRIHAVLRAVAGSSDGRGRSVLAPKAEGEALAMSRALAQAKIPASSVEYVECHGTGTALGDVVELKACAAAYTESVSDREAPLWIGSVKSNIGHLNSAAGVPALIKATLAVRDGEIPPSIKARSLNPAVDFNAARLSVVTRPQKWSGGKGPRRAGVSGFGVGGTNMHLIVEEYRPSEAARRPDPSTVVALPQRGSAEPIAASPIRQLASSHLDLAVASGEDPRECVARLRELADAPDYLAAIVERQQSIRASGRREGTRVAVVAASPELLRERIDLLDRAIGHGHDLGLLALRGVFVGRPATAGQVAVTFPGQGPQYPNMLRDAAARFPVLEATLREADEAYVKLSGRPLRPAFWTDGPDEYEQPDEDIHCAVFAVNVALYRLLVDRGLVVDAAMGQSAGELSALVAANVLSLADALAAVRERTCSVLALDLADPGRMVTLGCSADRARPLLLELGGYAVVAADNSPEGCIVSASTPAATALAARAEQLGIEARVLAVSHGYHSDLIAGARPRYRAALDRLSFSRSRCRIVSTITGGSIEGLAPGELPALLERQFIEPVRLQDAVLALHRQGVRTFIECGPKSGLTTFTKAILGERPHVAQATIHPKVGEVEQLHRALACLFVQGALDERASRESIERVRESRPVEVPVAPLPAAAVGPVGSLLGSLDSLGSLATRENSLSMLRAIGQVIDAFVRQAELAAGATETREQPSRPAAELAARVAEPEPVRAAKPEPVRAAEPEPVRAAEPVREPVRAAEPVREPEPVRAAEPKVDVRAVEPTPAKPEPRVVERREAKPVEPKRSAARSSRDPAPASLRPLDAPKRATSSSSQSRASRNEQQLAAEVIDLLRAKLVQRTGYPEDMLELDLDLEADLGIDTVKQVAIFAEARDHWGLEQLQGVRLRDFNTLRKVADHFTERLLRRVGPGVEHDPARPADVGRRPEPPPRSREVRPSEPPSEAPSRPSAEPRRRSAAAAEAPRPRADRGSKTSATDWYDEVEMVLRARLVERTGYPADMLEPDLDLEADLGIDTVKQVVIFAETRSHFGTPPDLTSKLRDFNTIRKVATHIADQLARGGEHESAVPRATEDDNTTQLEVDLTWPSNERAAKPEPVRAREEPSRPRPVAREPVREQPASREVASSSSAKRTAGGDSPDAFAQVHAVLLRKMIERTGYPEDMLELDLDLEADLGIDTVKQVAIFAETRTHFNVPQDPSLKLRDFNTMRKVAEYLAGRMTGSPTSSSSPPARPRPTAVPESSAAPARARAPERRTHEDDDRGRSSESPPARDARVRPANPPTSASTSTSASAGNGFDEIVEFVVRTTALRTGYPEDMLQLDLDLEADLGIDTVKQVAIFSEAREHYGLERDPGFRLRDFNTLRKVCRYLTARVGEHSPGARGRSSTGGANVVSLPTRRESGSRTTHTRSSEPDDGGPREPLVLRDSGRLGALEHVEVREVEPEEDEAAAANGEMKREFTWSSPVHTVSHQRQLLDAVSLTCLFEGLLEFEPPSGPTELEGIEFALGSRPVPGERLAVDIRGPNPRHYAVRVQANQRMQVNAEACIGVLGERAIKPRREVRVAIERELGRLHRDKAPMSRTATGGQIAWLETLRFDTMVGEVKLTDDTQEAARYTAIIDGAFAFASIAWYRLTGGVYKLASIDHVKFYRLPEPGSELYFHIRLASRLGGRWRADAVALDGELRMVGEILGVSGHPALAGDTDPRSPSPADSGAFGWRIIDIG
jgi:acyl transferase domain-containing protein